MAEQANKRLERRKASYRKSVSRITKQANASASARTSEKPKRETHLWEILSFVLPFVLMLIGFAVSKMHPFGDRQFLVTDLWHQYYPFFQTLAEKLKEGGSLLYSWRSGMGTNFLSLMAYYAASPLNLLSILAPAEYLREAMTIILMLKFSFAGLFFCRMLRYVFGKNDMSTCMFAVMYALCSYMVGYYWNTIWIDTVALLPLVMHGLTALVREGKYRTYVIGLALALISNYYIGLFICIFTVLAFFSLCWTENIGIRKFGKRFALITGGSLLGAGIASWILLPAFHALQLTYSVTNTFPKKVEFYESWRAILSNMLAFNEVTSKDGLPNLYCGFLPVLLLGVFLAAKKVRLREKIVALLLMAFLLFSCNFNILNFLWHGMHFPNMLPYRFSFLFSFVVLVAAYRAYRILVEEEFSYWHWGAMIVTGIVFCGLSYGSRTEGDDPNKFVFASAILGGIYLIVMYCRTFLPKQVVQVLLAAVLAFEMGQYAINGVKSVGSSAYDSYPTNNADVQALLDHAEELEEGDDLFYRTELTMWYTLNDPTLYYYDGISQFSSMANQKTTTFMKLLGLPASEAGNRYYYANTSPFTNMLLNIQYVIAKDGYNADSLSYSLAAQSGNCKLYQSEYDLSMGFMADSAAARYQMDKTLNAFEMQNVLFKRMTGVNEDLFTAIDITHVGHKGYDVTRKSYGNYNYTRQAEAAANESFLKLNYTTKQDGMVYAFMKVTNGDYLDVYYQDVRVHRYNIAKQPYITPVGNYAAGEMVTLRCDLDEEDKNGTAIVYFYQLNEEVLNAGYAALADEKLRLTEFSDTSFTGVVTANADGQLYLSVPYEEGWTAYVDGKKTEVVPMFDAICSVPLTAGTHTVTMKYSPKGFIPGLIISISGVALLVVLYLLERRRAKQTVSAPANSKAVQKTAETENESEEA